MRNGTRSQNGRSATARRAIFSATGKTDGFYTNTKNGGGMKKVEHSHQLLVS